MIFWIPAASASMRHRLQNSGNQSIICIIGKFHSQLTKADYCRRMLLGLCVKLCFVQVNLCESNRGRKIVPCYRGRHNFFMISKGLPSNLAQPVVKLRGLYVMLLQSVLLRHTGRTIPTLQNQLLPVSKPYFIHFFVHSNLLEKVS